MQHTNKDYETFASRLSAQNIVNRYAQLPQLLEQLFILPQYSPASSAVNSQAGRPSVAGMAHSTTELRRLVPSRFFRDAVEVIRLRAEIDVRGQAHAHR